MSTTSPGALLRTVIDAPRRLDELSTARVIERAAELVHKQQKGGNALGTITPDSIFVSNDGVELRTGATGVAYAAPETTGGKKGDRRSDVYSLGAVLWEALAHEKLTLGKFTPPSEHNANVPSELDAICKKALSSNPTDRYPSAKVLAAEIATVLEDAGYPEDQTQIAAYLNDAFPPITAGNALAAKLASTPTGSGSGKKNKNKELNQTMMGIKPADLGITPETLKAAAAPAPVVAEPVVAPVVAAPVVPAPPVAPPVVDDHASATKANMAARQIASAVEANLVAEPLKNPPPQNLHQTLPFGSNAVSATDLASAVAQLQKPQAGTPSPDPDVATTTFSKIDTSDLTAKEIPKVDPPIVAEPVILAKKVDEEKPTEKKPSIASAETVATPALVPTPKADDKPTNKVDAADVKKTEKIDASEVKPTDKVAAEKPQATILDDKQLDAPAPAATIAGLPSMPPGAGDAPIPKFNDDDFATGTGKKYPDGPPEMPAPLKPTDTKPTDLAAKSSTSAAATTSPATDPAAAISLPFRSRRDSQGDIIFEKWAASTGEHSALDDGHEEDIVEEQRKQKKRLIMGVGGSLAVILLVAIIALAFGGKKTPVKKEDTTAETGVSRTAPEPSTKATDSPTAPEQQPAGVGSDQGSAVGSDQGSAGSAAMGSDTGSSAQVGSDQGSADQAATAEAQKLADEAAAKKKADDEAAAKQAEDDRVAKEKADAEAAKKAEADRLAKEKADADAAKLTEAERAAKEKQDAAAAKKAEADRIAQEKKDAAAAAKAQADADKQAKADAAKQSAADKKAKADADKAAKAEADKLAAADKKAKTEADKAAKAEADKLAAADRKTKADAAKADAAKVAKTEPKKTEPKKTEPKEPKKAEPKKVAKAEPIDPYAEPKKPAGDPAANYKLGFQQFVRGDSAGALQTFRDSLSANPGYPPTYRGLGLVYEKMGQKGQAKRAFQRYLQLSPDAPDADQIRERMQRL